MFAWLGIPPWQRRGIWYVLVRMRLVGPLTFPETEG